MLPSFLIVYILNPCGERKLQDLLLPQFAITNHTQLWRANQQPFLDNTVKSVSFVYQVFFNQRLLCLHIKLVCNDRRSWILVCIVQDFVGYSSLYTDRHDSLCHLHILICGFGNILTFRIVAAEFKGKHIDYCTGRR
jgi:hypothetical protein